MDLGLQDKTALVLAGGGGLGGAIALALAREGARVAVAGRHIVSVQRTVDEIARIGGTALALEWDLGDLGIIDARVTSIEKALGPVDILVNNSGGPPPTPVAGQDPSLWMQQFQAMILSLIATTDRILPGMRARGWGRVITSTSSGIEAPIANLGLSNTLRSSLVGWSKTLSQEVARDGITVNIVIPGRIETKRVRAIDANKAQREGRTAEEVRAEAEGAIPLGRYGRAEEYADVVTFLASPRASYVTGAMIRVDGGLIPSV